MIAPRNITLGKTDMLIMELERVDDGVKLPVNLEQVCFAGPVKKKGSTTEYDPNTCVLCMTNGVVLHVKKKLDAITTAMKNYK